MPNIPYNDHGIAGIQRDTFTQIELFFGDTPLPVTEDATLPEALATAGVAQWTPVHLNHETRKLSLVDLDAEEPVLANAVTVFTVDPESPAGVACSVYTAGHFNINAINWPATVDTEAKRRGAFAAETANQIRVSKPYYS